MKYLIVIILGISSCAFGQWLPQVLSPHTNGIDFILGSSGSSNNVTATTNSLIISKGSANTVVVTNGFVGINKRPTVALDVTGAATISSTLTASGTVTLGTVTATTFSKSRIGTLQKETNFTALAAGSYGTLTSTTNITYTLITPSLGEVSSFWNTNGTGISVKAPTGHRIWFGSQLSADGGYLTNTLPGGYVELRGVNATSWVTVAAFPLTNWMLKP